MVVGCFLAAVRARTPVSGCCAAADQAAVKAERSTSSSFAASQPPASLHVGMEGIWRVCEGCSNQQVQLVSSLRLIHKGSACRRGRLGIQVEGESRVDAVCKR